MVTWWKWLRVIVSVATILGVSYMFVFVYETTNYWLGLAVIVFGSFILALMVVWVSRIQDNINLREGNNHGILEENH